DWRQARRPRHPILRNAPQTTAVLVDWICRGDLGIPRPLFSPRRVRGFKPLFFGKGLSGYEVKKLIAGLKSV
uniref:hypothetical protein n=1 Tax=Okeania sp. SIO2F4 TaxID=2607790 RepID=UPI0025CC3694